MSVRPGHNSHLLSAIVRIFPVCDSRVLLSLVVLMTAFAGGCGESKVPAPPIKPADLARAVMEQCDKNHDNKIDAAEAKQFPGLQAALDTMDPNHQGSLTETQIAARIQQWANGDLRVVTPFLTVTLDGKPLEGATVTLEPEAFMGPDYHSVTAVTGADGSCAVTGDNLKVPGVYVGLYRVKITKSGEKLPAKYNTQTTLGLEVAPGSQCVRRPVDFNLTSK
jgi:hypothetical protein